MPTFTGHGLLAGALRRPLGLAALLGALLCGIVLMFGEAMLGPPVQGIRDYVLMALFATGALLLCQVLRATEEVDPLAAPEPADDGPGGLEGQRRPRGRRGRRSEVQHWQELGDDRYLEGEDDLARAAYERALDLCRQNGDPIGESELLRRLAQLDGGGNRLERMRERLLEARDRSRAADDRFGQAMTLIELAELAHRQGEAEVAERWTNEARALLREIAAMYGTDAAALLQPVKRRTDAGSDW